MLGQYACSSTAFSRNGRLAPMPRSLNSREIGDALEVRVRDYFRAEIAADRFWAKKENCRVFWKKGYHSKDRNSKIVFDVSVELYLPGAKDYSAVVLIECKNYSHGVPVDDVEELFAKVQQVAAANAKVVLASTACFQTGTREYARSKGIGLLRYFDQREFKWELKRSPSASAGSTPPDEGYLVEKGLSLQDFRSLVFDLYLQSPSRETNSLWDFFEDLVLDTGLAPEEIRRINNSRNRLTNQVPYLEKGDLESRSLESLANVNQIGGETNLDDLCAHEAQRSGLVVKTEVTPTVSVDQSPALGRIIFEPLTIEIFASRSAHRGRDRFTLAHELAHHFLSHGLYMVREYCDDDDFVLHRNSSMVGSDVARMEFQANYFASCLLMPRLEFVADFQRLVHAMDIPDRGSGALYVDSQPCNIQNFKIVTGRLMKKYGVSRTAAKIRLESIGLLRDGRQKRGLQPILGNLDLTTDG